MITPVHRRWSVVALLIAVAACSNVTVDGRPSAAAAPATALFGAPQPWTKDVAGLPPSERSDAIITALTSLGGWRGGDRLQTDFSMPLLSADATTPRRTITAPADGYCFDGPDCDPVPLAVPIPADGRGEIALTFADDRHSTAKWATLGSEARSFAAIGPEQFEVVDLGPEIPLTFACAR